MGTTAQTMAWLMDEYHRLEGFQPACVTGKPVALFGAPGREEATGRGVIGVTVAALERRKQSIEGARVVIQGFGNVGRFAALAAIEAGMKVVAISDITGAIHQQQGIDFSDIGDKFTVASFKSKNEKQKNYENYDRHFFEKLKNSLRKKKQKVK
jgi:glutamate dehydrogenase (NAD(P)+)